MYKKAGILMLVLLSSLSIKAQNKIKVSKKDQVRFIDEVYYSDKTPNGHYKTYKYELGPGSPRKRKSTLYHRSLKDPYKRKYLVFSKSGTVFMFTSSHKTKKVLKLIHDNQFPDNLSKGEYFIIRDTLVINPINYSPFGKANVSDFYYQGPIGEKDIKLTGKSGTIEETKTELFYKE